MCRYSYYRFIFLTPLLFLSAGLFAQPSLENMNHRAEGFWRIKDTQAGNCSTCPPMHGTHYFYYKLGYVCLEIGRPERNPLAQRVKDVFRLQSRWEDNILYIRLPIGKWWPLARLDGWKFMVAGNGKVRTWEKIGSHNMPKHLLESFLATEPHTYENSDTD